MSVPIQEGTFLKVYDEREDTIMMWGYGFGLGLADDVDGHDTLDCYTRSARLGAHPLVE